MVRLLRVPIAIIHLFGWALALKHQPLIALGFLAFYIHCMAPKYRAFWATYPYMFSPRNLLAAVATDFSPILIGLWGILTVNTDCWVHGDGITARKQPGVTTEPTEKLAVLTQAASGAAGQNFADAWASTAAHARTGSQVKNAVLSGIFCLPSDIPVEPGHIDDQSKEEMPITFSEDAEAKKEQ